jgi:hypothetical protein
VKAQHDMAPDWFGIWLKGRLSRSHKYKTTNFFSALNSLRKFLNFFTGLA